MQNMQEYRNILENKGFSNRQIEVILDGINKKLDISPLLDRSLDYECMKQIELAIEEGLDTSLLTKYSFSSEQLNVLRRGLKAGVDISKFAYTDLSFLIMDDILKGLQENIDLSIYLKYDCDYMLSTIFKVIKKGIDVESLFKDYDKEIAIELLEGYRSGIDLKPYVDMGFNEYQLNVIKEGLSEDLDVSVYVDKNYSAEQMREILEGLRLELEVSTYANVNNDENKMRSMRNTLEASSAFTESLKENFLGVSIQSIQYITPNSENWEEGILLEIEGTKKRLVVSNKLTPVLDVTSINKCNKCSKIVI